MFPERFQQYYRQRDIAQSLSDEEGKDLLLGDLPAPSHGGNREVDVLRWGLSVAQFLHFIAVAKQMHSWASMEQDTHDTRRLNPVTGTVYHTIYNPPPEYIASRCIVEPGHVNAYQLCNWVVKPFTMGTGSGMSLHLNPEEPLAATVMVSHTWAEDMSQAAEALAAIPSTTAIWFCVLANYQPEDGCGPTITE